MSSGMLTSVFASFKGVEHGLEAEAITIVEKNGNIIIDMNTAQLYEGLNSKGQSLESIGGPYAPLTVEIKKTKGQPTDRVTLKDEEDFYRGFYVKVSGGIWQISSKDDKTDKLIQDWGEYIFGNTEEDQKEFNLEYILPGLIEWILQNLHL